MIAGMLAGKTASQAARDAGYSESTARFKSARMLTDPEFTAALERAGLTYDYLAKRLKELLDATEVKVFHYRDKILYSRPLVAWDSRARGLDIAFRTLGLYPKMIEPEEQPCDGPVVNVQLVVAKLNPQQPTDRSDGKGIQGFVPRTIEGPGSQTRQAAVDDPFKPRDAWAAWRRQYRD